MAKKPKFRVGQVNDGERWLKRHGYELKQTTVGHWVDGNCGFLVCGYFGTKREAISTAIDRIREVGKKNEWPTWRIAERERGVKP